MSKTDTKIVRSFCTLCKSRCGATYQVRDGTLIAARAFPEHPTGKALCMKGKAAPEILYSEDRILYPLRRTAPKDAEDPRWERITWDEALGEIADKLGAVRDMHGAEAVALGTTTPSGTPFSDAFDWVHRFQYAFGTPNNVSGTEICNWHKDSAHAFTVGSSILYPDYANADTIVLWGFNPSAVWLDQATQVAQARARGATIIVVDPRDAGYARDADHWLRIKPGTDGVLLMGMANLMISQQGINAAFLTEWSNGPFLVRDDTGMFLRAGDLPEGAGDDYVALGPDGELIHLPERPDDRTAETDRLALNASTTVETRDGPVQCSTAFARYANTAAQYPLERVTQETGIPRDQIEAATKALIRAASVCYYTWTGTAQQGNATQTDRALAMLMSMKGCYDSPGGNVAFSKHRSNFPGDFSLLSSAQRAKALGLEERPLGPPAQGMITSKDFYTSVLEAAPYKIRAMLSFGANHIMSHGETDRAVAAYQKLEFFAYCAPVLTPTAKNADIVLPVNTPWEREALKVGFDSSQDAMELIQFRQAVVPSRGDSRSDLDIVFDLAVRLGHGDDFFDGDIHAGFAHVLKPTGVNLDELKAAPEGIRKPLSYKSRKYASPKGSGVQGFATDTGRIEIYSELFHRHGYAPIPAFSERNRDKVEYPFTLTTAKSGYYCHSQYRNVPSLRKRFPEPLVFVSTVSAEDLGLSTGDMVWIKNSHGRIQMRLKTDDALPHDVVSASYGWWQENKILGLPGYDPLSEKGANYNRLIVPDTIDPISGAVPLRLGECRLEPVAQTRKDKPAWSGFAPAEVSAMQAVADGVMRVEFKVDGMDRLPDYDVGQHLALRVSHPETGKEVTRCYSLVGTAVDPERSTYTISVCHVVAPSDTPHAPNGVMSSLVNTGLTVGDRVELQAPKGRFVIPVDGDVPLVLIAGGIGITPFLCALETAAATGTAPRIHLIYANRNSAHHAYRRRINVLRTAIPSLSVTDIYSAPLDGDIVGATHDKTGFVTAEDILLPEFDNLPQVFQCGPPPMMAAVETALDRHGFPADRLHKEAFVSPMSEVPVPDGPFTVEFTRSKVTAEWSKNKGTLLEFAESLGLKLESGCRAGQCESCAVTVFRGNFLSLTESTRPSDGSCLICQAVPEGNMAIDA